MEQEQTQEQILVVNPEKLELVSRRDSGASWFNTVGIFAVINYFLIAFNVKVQFIFALGITSIVTAVAHEMHTGLAGHGISLLFTLLGCAGAFFFASFARRGYSWAFIAGMVLYALDGMLWLVFQDWIEVVAHAYAVYCMGTGLRANRELARRFPGNTGDGIAPGSGITPVSEVVGAGEAPQA